MGDVRRTLEREIEGIPPAGYPLEAVARRRDRRRRNRRVGSGVTGALVALVGAVVLARAIATPPEHAAVGPRVRLVFVSPGFGDPGDRLYASNGDGTDLVMLADIRAEYPEWSPDGRAVAFDDGWNLVGSTLPIPSGNVYVVDADGSDLRRVSAGGGMSAPSWSPDGSRLAVAAARGGEEAGISWLDIRTGQETIVTTNPFGRRDGEPDVSPDGATIAFIRTRASVVAGDVRDLAALFVVNADGTGLRQLTQWGVDAATPDWSPDGSTIAFNTNDHFDPDRTQRIVLIDADGSDQRTLVRAADAASYWPTWSPDGELVVFTRVGEGPAQLFVVAASGGEATPFPSAPEMNQADLVLVP